MGVFQMNLTAEEHELLTEILNHELKEKRVEEHRTDSTDYKRMVARQAELVEGMLSKLRTIVVA
jgi:hypothetical protein